MSGKFMMNGVEYLGGGSGGGGGNVDDVLVNGLSVVNENKEAEIVSYKEVTLAEYQALPDSKLTDNVMYCIKDIGGANQFPPLIYSDEEREVGVWRDGKPLYQKSVPFSINYSGTYQKTIYYGGSINITGVDKIINSNGYWIQTANTPNEICEFNTTQINWQQNGAHSTGVYVANNEINIRITLNSDNYPQYTINGVVTVWYTKTTDTPGSGTWTTDGTYTKHYSTSEKVIGTWIDGKPLYEITTEFSSEITVDNTIWTNTTIPNTDKKAIVNVIGINSTGTCWNMLSANCDTGSYVQVYHTRGTSITLKILTIQYTKTTD